MLRSLFSGISGLRTHQTLMDVVSNNISNVNTTGFKTSATVFEDTLSQTLRTAGLPTGTLGGLNPAQIGLGVQLAAITTNFRQGSAQSTGKSTDLMLQGDGFFIVDNGSQRAYTRAGAFNFDTAGTLVNAEGMRVQGWPGVNGVVNTDGSLTDIVVPAGKMIKPTPSSKVTTSGNISNTTTPSTLTLGSTVYDSAGLAHSLSIVLTPNAGAFDVTVTDMTDPGSTATAGTLSLLPSGAYDPGSTSAVLTTADGTAVTVDMTGVSNYGGPKSLAVTGVDGASAGSLQQFQIDQDGTIIGVFSNQQKQALGKIALANFTNPSGLEKIGSTAFVETGNSGLPQVGVAGSGGRGTLLGSSLEMSNVDLAQEFTNMIIAQRGFQANSRVITTSDQMLQELVDIKR
ncbi:MAG: flagellar hook protein FlgE [Kineosporiaceae bacterium]